MQAAKQASKAAIALARGALPELDLVEALETYERLQRDSKTLHDTLKTIGDGDMHGRLRACLSAVERMRTNVRTLLRETP
jgi:hypothetical protein